MQKSTVVLGVGNILLSDEGIGVHVARALMQRGLPPDVEVIDGGTGGYELIDFLRDRRKVVIVDCIMADEPPGTVICATPDELNLQWGESYSAHGGGLRELLDHAQLLSPRPKITIVGVVPENADRPGMELSRTLDMKLARITEEVLRIASNE